MINSLLTRFVTKRFQASKPLFKIPYSPNDKLLLVFTCKKCNNRSSHQISKHGYYKGSVICECPKCKNRHLISDHMNIFQDDVANLTLEDILKKQGVEISYDINAIKDNEIPEELMDKIKKLQNQNASQGTAEGNLITDKKN